MKIIGEIYVLASLLQRKISGTIP